MSNDLASGKANKDKPVLVLIQGTGAVRAGIWARSVCMNDSLEKGSMLPFLDQAQKNNWNVLVMNPNYNKDPATGVTCPFSQSMDDHACNVWLKYISKPEYTNVYVVAHSAGGGCLNEIIKTHGT